MRYEVRLSDRAAKDLDRLNRDAQERVMKRLARLAEDPFDGRLPAPLTDTGGPAEIARGRLEDYLLCR